MLYQEDQLFMEVEVLADNSDDEFYRYDLKAVKTLKASQRYNPIPDGEEFKAEQKKMVKYGFCWSLEPMPQEAVPA